MDEKLYLETDDRLDVGNKPMKHTDSRGQKLHDELVKNRKEILRQFQK